MIRLKKLGTKIEEIGKQLQISDRSVNKYTKNIKHPNKKEIIHLPKNAINFSKEKAEIIGYLCAEGNDADHTTKYWCFDKRRGKSYYSTLNKKHINFSNTCKEIQDHFIFLMKKIYNYPLKPSKNGTFYIKRIEVVKDLRRYTNYGSRKWKVPAELFNKYNKNQAIYFLKGYMDGDGTITLRKRVEVDSVNSLASKQTNKLFKKLGFITTYYEKVYSDRNRILIKDIITYKKLIGFLEPNKKERLEKFIRGH